MRLGKTVFAGATVLNDTVIPIRGAGTLRYMGFKVYSGALYAPKNTANLDAAPKRLTLHYYRSIDRKTIVEASWEVLADNPEVDLTALRPRLERLL